MLVLPIFLNTRQGPGVLNWYPLKYHMMLQAKQRGGYLHTGHPVQANTATVDINVFTLIGMQYIYRVARINRIYPVAKLPKAGEIVRTCHETRRIPKFDCFRPSPYCKRRKKKGGARKQLEWLVASKPHTL